MIIKKNKAKQLLTQPPQTAASGMPSYDPSIMPAGTTDPQWSRTGEASGHPSGYAMPPTTMDPYRGSIQAEDFLSGRLMDRRKTRDTDRRQDFRREEDHELLSTAHQEANAIRERAQQEGFQEGIRQSQPVIDELSEAIQGFLESRERVLDAAARDIGSIAMEVAKRIIATEVTCDDELVVNIVRKTIRKVGKEQKIITVHVHPMDVARVEKAIDADPPVKGNVQVYVQEDDTVDLGSCMIETQAGMIDARFSTQLDVLQHLVLSSAQGADV